MPTPSPCSDPHAIIRALAARQHGVVLRAQLAAAGLPRHAIDNRVRNGRLVGLYRGVYRVPEPVLGRYEPEMAAVLASGEGAVLSHRSAAALWTLQSLAPGAPQGSEDRTSPIEVSVVGRCIAPGPGVRVHRVARLASDERTTRHGIPITTPARTLVDLAGVARTRALEQAMAVAMREGLADRESLERIVASHRGRPGVAAMRALLAESEAPAFTRSDAEERFLDLVRSARLPAPRTNVVVEGFEVDFFWPRARLVAEVDGFAYHRMATAFDRDRRRDGDLIAAGHRVMRVTWHQLTRERDALLARLVRALAWGGA